jgi:hypothetical protein
MPLNALSLLHSHGFPFEDWRRTRLIEKQHLGGMNHKSTTEHLHGAENVSINPKPLTLSITGVTFELEGKTHNQRAHFHSLSVI